MNETYSRGHMRSDEHAEKTKRSKGALIIMIVLGLAIIGLIVYAQIKKRTTYTSFETTVSYRNTDNSEVVGSDSGYVMYNRDGAEGHDAAGKVIWKVSYDMASPIAAVSGECAAFADCGAQNVCVTDGSGANHTFSVPEKITGICVASQGVTAVRTDAGESDHIYIYDIAGTMLLDVRTEVRTSGFPITMALSPEGSKLVTSYIKVGQEQESWLTFYNFGDVGQNYVDKIVGSFSFSGRLIPDIRFLNENAVIAVCDDSCTIYKFREIPEEVGHIDYPGGITSVTSGDGCFALASVRAEGINEAGLFNADGGRVTKVETNMDIGGLSICGDELVLLSGQTCDIYRKNGSEKLKTKLDEDVRLILPSGTDGSYTVVGKNNTQIIKLKTKADEKADANTAETQ